MPKEDRFFGLFDRHAATLVDGARALVGLLEGGEAVPRCARLIAQHEEVADEITRESLRVCPGIQALQPMGCSSIMTDAA